MHAVARRLPWFRSHPATTALAPELFLPLLLVAILGCYIAIILSRTLDADEFESMHAAWQIAQGQMIYRDFFEHHHPLFYLLLAPLLAIVPESSSSLLLLRLLNLGLAIGTTAVTYLLASRIYGRLAGLASTILLTTAVIFQVKAIEVRPDNLQTLCGLAGLYLLVRFFERRRRVLAFASGAMFALSLLALQKACFLLGTVGCVVLLRIAQRRCPWQCAVPLSAGFAAAIVPLLIWLVATDTTTIFWQLNYQVNAGQTYVLRIAKTISRTPEVYSLPLRSVGQNPVLWGFFAIGALHAIRPALDRPAPDLRLRREVLFVTLVLLAWIIVFNKYLLQYYTPAIPFVAIIAAGGLADIFHRHRLAAVALLVATSVGTGYVALDDYRKDTIRPTLDRVDRALAVTRAGDKVLDYLSFNVFRPDLSYMWFVEGRDGVLRNLTRITGFPYDVWALIEQQRPALIARTALPRGTSTDDPRLGPYRPLPGVDDLLVRRDP